MIYFLASLKAESQVLKLISFDPRAQV